MVSTHKMILLFIGLQLIIGAGITWYFEPTGLPNETIASFEQMAGDFQDDLTDEQDLVSRNINTVVSGGETGVNAVSAISWMGRMFLNGITVPYTYQPGGALTDQLIMFAIKIYHFTISMFFAMEFIMFLYSKKTS